MCVSILSIRREISYLNFESLANEEERIKVLLRNLGPEKPSPVKINNGQSPSPHWSAKRYDLWVAALCEARDRIHPWKKSTSES